MVADAGGQHFYAPTRLRGLDGVHVLGGLVGLVGAWYVDRGGANDRQGAAGDSRQTSDGGVGALLLAFCCFGFNCGSVVANYFKNPAIARGRARVASTIADFCIDIWWSCEAMSAGRRAGS